MSCVRKVINFLGYKEGTVLVLASVVVSGGGYLQDEMENSDRQAHMDQ